MASMLALCAGAEREGTGIEREKERDASDKQREATGADRKTLIAECRDEGLGRALSPTLGRERIGRLLLRNVVMRGWAVPCPRRWAVPCTACWAVPCWRMASMLVLRAGAEREGTGIDREKERDASDKQREATGADRKTLIAECRDEGLGRALSPTLGRERIGRLLLRNVVMRGWAVPCPRRWAVPCILPAGPCPAGEWHPCSRYAQAPKGRVPALRGKRKEMRRINKGRLREHLALSTYIRLFTSMPYRHTSDQEP